ncbi:MAG: ImmA/IrrE family metallo-endopeptidase [Actinobacteria bacterium]|nr:ImmA/IrrE family metallo-endopeptidase [Actinomycetota bacterium]
MNVAIAKAKEVFGLYGNDLDKVLDKLGIQAVDAPLAGRLKELYFGDVIVLKEGLSEAERRELIAHALGHHFLHAGNHLAASKGAYSWDKFQERQADVFAAYLLIPKIQTDKAFKMAEKNNITEKFAAYRLKLATAFEHRRAV